MTAPRLAVVLGPCDAMRAEVFFRVEIPGATVAPRLAGTLVGPQCSLAVTLPVTARVVDRGPAPHAALAEAVGRAIVTEPAYWTPDLPAVYRLELDVAGPDGAVPVRCAGIGLRRLGVRRRSFWLDGRRWVPRGVFYAAEEFDAQAVRTMAATAVLREPDEAPLAAADAAGVAVVALLDRLDDGAAERVAAWALHPAVLLAVVPAAATTEQAATLAAAVRRVKGTLLLGRAVSGAAPPGAVPDGIDCLVVAIDRGRSPHEGWRDPPAVPLVARRGADLPPDERRRACDTLQAELAAWGMEVGGPRLSWDWAGYIVG